METWRQTYMECYVNVPASERNVKRTQNDYPSRGYTVKKTQSRSFRHGDEPSKERTFHQGNDLSLKRKINFAKRTTSRRRYIRFRHKNVPPIAQNFIFVCDGYTMIKLYKIMFGIKLRNKDLQGDITHSSIYILFLHRKTNSNVYSFIIMFIHLWQCSDMVHYYNAQKVKLYMLQETGLTCDHLLENPADGDVRQAGGAAGMPCYSVDDLRRM